MLILKKLLLQIESQKVIGKTASLFAFLLFIMFPFISQAQRHFNDEKNFVQDMRQVIERKSQPTTLEIADGVAALWSSGLSEEQKSVLFKVAKNMYKRNYPTNPTSEDFYACIVYGKKNGRLTDELLTSFLQVADTTVLEGSIGVATNFYRITRLYLTENKLYKYREFSGVNVEGNTNFSFGYGREVALTQDAVELPEDVTKIIENQTETDDTNAKSEEESLADLWGETETKTDNDGWANDGWDTSWEEEDTGDAQPDPDVWGSPDEWGSQGDWGEEETSTDKTEKENTNYGASVKPNLTSSFVAPIAEKTLLAGPYMQLDNISLTIQTPNDTVQIKNTTGQVVFAKGAFTGEGGRFDWGVVPNVYGEFSKFSFEVKKPEIKAEEFKLYYSSYTDSAVVGQFDYFASRTNNKENPLYPRFISYKNDIEVKGFLKDIIYQGGFSLIGKKIVSKSLGGGASSIRLEKEGKIRFRSTSRQDYVFSEHAVTNRLSQLIIYTTEKDSLSHQGVKLRYDDENEQLLARRNKKIFKYAPFMDSYHNVSISADYLNWDIKSDTMNIYSLAGRGAVMAAYEAASRNEAKRDSILKQIDFVTITSNAYFNEYELRAVQGMYPFNPLVMAWAYIAQRRPFGLSFTSADLANHFKQKSVHVKSSMRDMAGAGFVEYDEAADWVTFTQKGVLYARANLPINNKLRSDYDQIRLSSLGTNSDNLTYYFENNELKVRGVEEVTYSNAKVDSINYYAVKAKPVDKEVIITENRNMTINGQVAAKNFIFNGEGFKFDYKDFKFDMEKIDSMQFFVDGDTMPNSFKDVSGTFSINLPYNKAGVYDKGKFKDSQRYPLFNTTSGGTVRFGGQEVMGGAYSDSTVRFDVDNFTLDSLAKRKPEDLRFGGTFNTPIFDKFKEPIRVMPDKSLGFTHDVNNEQHADGMSLYGGKGKLLTGRIVVSNSGIRAGSERYIQDIEENPKKNAKTQETKDEVVIDNELAKMTYLAAELNSNDFIFFTDSVTSKGEYAAKLATSQGKINAVTIDDAMFPQVELENYRMKWLPKQDSMMLSTTDTPFRMYKGEGGTLKEANYTGTLALTPKGLKGYGTVETQDAIIESKLFAFETTRVFGRESDFQIKSVGGTLPPAVAANNVKFEYDILASPRTATITSEVLGEQVFDFPSLKYKTSLATGYWNADAQTVAFRLDETGNISKQYFVSTAPEQDSLNFRAAFANYHIPSGNLTVGGVPYILVVDTEIYPREGNITIRENAKMDKLEDAELVINYINKYHKLTEANVDILSRNEYQGEAVLNYDNGTDKIQYLRLNNYGKQLIKEEDLPDSLRKTSVAEKLIDTEGTISVTTIEEKDDVIDDTDFIYSEGKQFRGEVTLKAWLSELEFNGQARLVIDGEAQTGWFPLVSAAYVDKNSKQAKKMAAAGSSELIEDQKIGGQPAFTGIYLSESGLFVPVMEENIPKSSEPILLGEGQVQVKPEEKSILILSEERANTSEIADGNSFKASKTLGTAEFDGKLTLFNSNQRAQVDVSGVGKANFQNKQYTVDAMVSINVEAKGDAFSFMRDDLNAFVEENRERLKLAPTVNKSKNTLLKIAGQTGAKEAQNFQKRFAPNDYGIADVISKTIVLSDVMMNWSPDEQTFYSVGDIGLAAILKEEIDVKTTGYLEIPQTGSRDEFTLYFELDPDKWYYFQFDGRTLKTLSSSEEYNTIITDPKSKDKFDLAEQADVDEFMARFRGLYPTTPSIPVK
ncbi:MAG: hypothetical protein COZ18_06990 [Flexibacter sp. CG_4_10_14_3_um_filter_32_15]|nr:MAG: hypothetical protein COZ18_06990 [Flexibacter sp. CG_4_10_14_3_um_filter_32_15]